MVEPSNLGAQIAVEAEGYPGPVWVMQEALLLPVSPDTIHQPEEKGHQAAQTPFARRIQPGNQLALCGPPGGLSSAFTLLHSGAFPPGGRA